MTMPNGKKERIWHDPPMPGIEPAPSTHQFVMTEETFRKMMEDSRNLKAFFAEIQRYNRQSLMFYASFQAFVTAVFLIFLPYTGFEIADMVQFFLLAGISFALIAIFLFSSVRPPKVT